MSWALDLILGAHNWYQGVSKIAASTKKTASPLRLGILGAAAINPAAIFDPVSTHPDVIIVGIAARSKSKAEAQIKQYSLTSARAYSSYDDLLSDPTIEAVYVPLPNGLHAEWAIKALQAGKHVLLEKPIASNAQQVRDIRRVSEETGEVALEAFHWRLYPAAHLVKSLVDSGEYGKATEVKAKWELPAGLFAKDDIRFHYDLAGGSCMDLMYVFSATSYYATPTPNLKDAEVEVLEAKARPNKTDPRIDDAMSATYVLRSDSHSTLCKIEADLAAPWLWGLVPKFWTLMPSLSIEMEQATILFPGFAGPWSGHAITVTDKATGKVTKHSQYVDGAQWGQRGARFWTTYRYQLEAFVDKVRAVQAGADVRRLGEMSGPWVSLDESEAVVGIVEKVYEKAGIPLRK
ncbi:Uu.00g016780.m01.CDS01 [Anthostomella pinea]|uniref:D-xylose 1-dehydrogenase (NADP(+), D-xylono-1,5-lactone-forming) n=1 Tax=Anthostomella pinea TaxID=933095 RepID=A0AAI8VZF5_9PEZI|nr:Uu.00g016780.m01.CDS01 [Anthostomella pinea]